LKKENIDARYSYSQKYIASPANFIEEIKNKTVIPHQVEIQPGPKSTKELCWLKCPYCYGLSAEHSPNRLELGRYLELLDQISEGGVKKIIFAGYATDPLNSPFIDQLAHRTLENKSIIGFHTKAIKVSEDLRKVLCSDSLQEKSYFSVSVDSGNNESYNIVHGVPNSKANLYDKVLKNIKLIAENRSKKSPIDLSVTYLINEFNSGEDEVKKFIEDYISAGVDMIRFTLPQVPRHISLDENNTGFVLDHIQVKNYYDKLNSLIKSYDSENCRVLILDLDADFDIQEKTRTLPCFARYIFPTIAYDGSLAHCSESGAPNLQSLQIGSLIERDFWDLFYSYDGENFIAPSSTFEKAGCKCDRKEHVTNSLMANYLLN